jgi:transcriptional regulator with XRE-family HTH domain
MARTARTMDNATGKYVGTRIRAHRVTKAMSQAQLGAAIGVTFQQIQKYEKGIDRLGVDRLVEIAEALNVPPAALMPTPNAANGPDLASLLDRPDAVRMLRAFSRVCGKYRPLLLDIVEGCAARWYPSCDC